MDAGGSAIVQPAAEQPGDELGAVFAAFELAGGLHLCFRPLSDRWQGTDGRQLVPPRFAEHRSSFCRTIKRHSAAACTKCDVTDLPTACSARDGGVKHPFVRTCHAGADEILLPLWSENVLVAVLFAGQFSRHDDGAPTGIPVLGDEEVQHRRSLLLPLRDYLLGLLAKLDGQRRERTIGRRGAIESYLRESLSSGPTLPDLARRLSLSRSRTSHLVQELTGESFQGLVERQRIAVAKDLLTHTDGTIGWVARQTGFTDVAYFCRYFKKKTATTPTAFRQRNRRIPSA